MAISQEDLNQFWFELSLALGDRTVFEVPLALRTSRAADVGWGRGMRILILDDGRITHPEGRFVPFAGVDPVEFANAIREAFKLTRTERKILNMLRDGAETYCYRGNKMAKVGPLMVRCSTLDRLCSLGLVEELSHGNDSEYVSVQPESVHR